MWSTPSSTARRRTARAASGSRGGPNTPGPASCIAPKPMRFTVKEPRLVMAPGSATVTDGTRRASIMGPGPPPSLARRDELAWNRAAEAVLGRPTEAPDGRPNLLWWLFTSKEPRGEQWRTTARSTLARFRAEHARRLADPAFAALLDALQQASPDFREWWALHEVLTEQLGTKMIRHPRIGTLRLHHLQSIPTSHPDLRLTQFTPADEATRATLASLM